MNGVDQRRRQGAAGLVLVGDCIRRESFLALPAKRAIEGGARLGRDGHALDPGEPGAGRGNPFPGTSMGPVQVFTDAGRGITVRNGLHVSLPISQTVRSLPMVRN